MYHNYPQSRKSRYVSWHHTPPYQTQVKKENTGILSMPSLEVHGDGSVVFDFSSGLRWGPILYAVLHLNTSLTLGRQVSATPAVSDARGSTSRFRFHRLERYSPLCTDPRGIAVRKNLVMVGPQTHHSSLRLQPRNESGTLTKMFEHPGKLSLGISALNQRVGDTVGSWK